MASLNRVFLLGNLTRDPEIRYLPSGKAVGDLRMAINRKFKSATGEEREEVCFVNVVVWGRQAETCGEYLAKGSALLVDGRLQYEEWEKDGQKNSRLRVVADRVQFMGAPKRAGLGDGPGAATEAASRPSVGEEAEPPPVGSDADNLPF
jgi:single-strand DNA-binding protein